MKTLGLIGGMSWESTLPYYRLINQGIRERLGGLRSARLVLYSVDFQPIEQHMRSDQWESAGSELAMLIGPQDTSVPLFDTTALHAQAAVDWALSA